MAEHNSSSHTQLKADGNSDVRSNVVMEQAPYSRVVSTSEDVVRKPSRLYDTERSSTFRPHYYHPKQFASTSYKPISPLVEVAPSAEGYLGFRRRTSKPPYMLGSASDVLDFDEQQQQPQFSELESRAYRSRIPSEGEQPLDDELFSNSDPNIAWHHHRRMGFPPRSAHRTLPHIFQNDDHRHLHDFDIRGSALDHEYPLFDTPGGSSQETLIDPSVLEGMPNDDWEYSAGRFRAGRSYSARRRNKAMNMDGTPEALHYSVDKFEDKRTATQFTTEATRMSRLPTGDAAEPVLQSKQNGHTAALILAFSLGLVCCFVGLLITEWRRRTRAQRWITNRPSISVPVLFGETGKSAVMRNRTSRRMKRPIRNFGSAVGVEEESKALCDSLVL